MNKGQIKNKEKEGAFIKNKIVQSLITNIWDPNAFNTHFNNAHIF